MNQSQGFAHFSPWKRWFIAALERMSQAWKNRTKIYRAVLEIIMSVTKPFGESLHRSVHKLVRSMRGSRRYRTHSLCEFFNFVKILSTLWIWSADSLVVLQLRVAPWTCPWLLLTFCPIFLVAVWSPCIPVQITTFVWWNFECDRYASRSSLLAQFHTICMMRLGADGPRGPQVSTAKGHTMMCSAKCG